MKPFSCGMVRFVSVATVIVALSGCSHVSGIREASARNADRRTVLPPPAVDAWIAFLGAKYRGESAAVPNELISLNDIFSVPHFTGVPVIFPAKDEVFYNLQTDVWRDNRTYRYNFSFTAKKGADTNVQTVQEFFSRATITKYYVYRFDLSSKEWEVENIVKNGRTDDFSLQK